MGLSAPFRFLYKHHIEVHHNACKLLGLMRQTKALIEVILQGCMTI